MQNDRSKSGGKAQRARTIRHGVRETGKRARPKCDDRPVEGGPRITPGAIWALAGDAGRMWLADGASLHVVGLRRDGTKLVATERELVKTPGTVTRVIAAPGGGALACVKTREGIAFCLIEGTRSRTLATVETCHDLAVTRSAVVTVEGRAGAAEIVSRDLRRGKVLRRLPLGSTSATLRPGARDEVAVIEGGGRIRIIDAARRADTCREPRGPDCRCDPPRPNTGPSSGPSPGPSSVPPRSGGCCCKCDPPHEPGSGPHQLDPDGRPPRRPGRDPDGTCVPGEDGTPDGCWVTIRRGTRIIRVNICDPDARPCVINVGHRVGTLHRTRAGLLARSPDGRRATVYDAQSLRKLRALTLEPGAEVQALFDSDELAVLSPNGTLAVMASGAASAAFDELAAPTATSAVYQGENPITLYDRDGPVIGMRTVMIVPALEPGQGFIGSTEDHANYYEMRDILEMVRDYYIETSYDDPPDNHGLNIRFIWFGADTPTIYDGPPIRLDEPFKTYWGPAWDPGHIRASVTPPGGGSVVSFSGDETMVLRCIPETDSYDPLDFTLRFPAGSYRSRIPDGISAITYEPAMPPRTITLNGTDRQGAPVTFTVNTSVLAGTTQVNLSRTSLAGSPAPLSELADVLEQMLEAGAPGIFERPSVVWQDDDDQGGLLHVSVSFAAGPGGSTPSLGVFDISDLLQELGGSGLGARFTLPGDEEALQTYLVRVVTDAQVAHPEFGPDLSEAYFELEEKWSPTVVEEDGTVTTRISLSTRHGRFPAIIELVSQNGLDQLGFDNPVEEPGVDTSFSGGGGPKFEDTALFSKIYTKMIDASIAYRGNEAEAIDIINQRFNCVGSEQFPIECAFDMIHSVVVTPVYVGTGILGAQTDPDLVDGERGAAKSVDMRDLRADERVKPVLPIGANRGKIVMGIASSNSDNLERHISSARTLAHEIGHGVLGLLDLYSGGTYRTNVRYMGKNCLMGTSKTLSHLCAFNKRRKGWLEDDACLLIDRPASGSDIDREVILIQLEYWDPTFDAATWDAIAQTALPGAAPDTPVVAAVFLRLGGDGRQFDIIELRGQGPRFSPDISPSRLVISNAIDPENETRYGEGEVENSGITEDVLKRYRRKVHLLSDELVAANVGTPDDTYNFAIDDNFPEVGLTAQVLEWGTAATSAGSFDVARVRLRWSRGAAINLGFRDATPDWQSQDIAIIRPEDIPPEGDPDFPAAQDDAEGFRIPAAGAPDLMHKVGVRVWNFGDAEALNVQVGLVRREPNGGGAGDWQDTDDDFSLTFDEPIGPGASRIAFFDWPVPPGSQTHMCWRAEIGDRDVPRDANGNALASDDTDASNDWAQQNVFEFTALGNSPPAPVEFTFEVANRGAFTEEVRVVPFGLTDGATVTVTPARMKIAPRSRGLFQIRAVLEERLLKARCGKDIDFRLVALRQDDHAEEPWGSSRYIIKPRIATQTSLNASVMPTQLRFSGKVTPDVGAQSVLLQIDRPGEPTLWQRVTMGPNATFDFALDGDFPDGITYTGVAYYDGSFEHGKSSSDRAEARWTLAG